MRHKSRNAALVCLAIVTMLALLATPAEAKLRRNVNPRVIPPQTMPYGLSYGDWAARSSQWWMETPYDVNPANDYTGANAGVGQSGPVWFLAQVLEYPDTGESVVTGGAERTFTVPAGKALFVPTYVSSVSWPFNCETEAEAREWNAWWMAHVTELEATVDGRPVRNLFAYGGASAVFQVQWRYSPAPEDWWTEPQPTIADGYFFILAPLRVGQHVIHTRNVWVVTAAEGWLDLTVITEMTYYITVTSR
jgi:hypothetical protein